MNIFMNLVKKSLVEGGTKSGVRASGGVRALVGASSLSAFNPWTGPWPANSFCSLVGSAERLMQKLHQVRDPEAIVMEI